MGTAAYVIRRYGSSHIEFTDYKTINRVPAQIRTQPTSDFTENGS